MKHILIVDLQDDSKCWGCPCLNEYGNCDGIPSGPGGAEIIDYIRPNDCPLRPMPEKKTKIITENGKEPLLTTVAYLNGWNACLDEIFEGK